MDDADTEVLREAGTDVVDILAGRVIPLRLVYAVVNRGQRDIDTPKPIQQAFDAERHFFFLSTILLIKARRNTTAHLSLRASLTWFVRAL